MHPAQAVIQCLGDIMMCCPSGGRIWMKIEDELVAEGWDLLVIRVNKTTSDEHRCVFDRDR
jgi:hypothetical protein